VLLLQVPHGSVSLNRDINIDIVCFEIAICTHTAIWQQVSVIRKVKLVMPGLQPTRLLTSIQMYRACPMTHYAASCIPQQQQVD